jgi:hypothetical protein
VLLRFVLLFHRIRRSNVSAVTAGLAAGHNSRQYPSLLSAASAADHRYRTVRAAAGIGAAFQEHTQRSRRATTEYQVRDRPNRLNDATQSPQRLRPTHLRTRTPGQVRQGHGGQYHLNRRANEDGRSLTFAEVAPPLFGSHGLSRYSERLNASDWTGRLPLLLCCAGQMQRWPWPSRMSQFRFNLAQLGPTVATDHNAPPSCDLDECQTTLASGRRNRRLGGTAFHLGNPLCHGARIAERICCGNVCHIRRPMCQSVRVLGRLCWPTIAAAGLRADQPDGPRSWGVSLGD